MLHSVHPLPRLQAPFPRDGLWGHMMIAGWKAGSYFPCYYLLRCRLQAHLRRGICCYWSSSFPRPRQNPSHLTRQEAPGSTCAASQVLQQHAERAPLIRMVDVVVHLYVYYGRGDFESWVPFHAALYNPVKPTVLGALITMIYKGWNICRRFLLSVTFRKNSNRHVTLSLRHTPNSERCWLRVGPLPEIASHNFLLEWDRRSVAHNLALYRACTTPGVP